jgi:hypothetical protein
MNPSMTLVRLDEPVSEEPADVLSVMPVVSVFDALDSGGLRSAMLRASNLPDAEELEAASLDDLMALVIEGLSRSAVWDLSFGGARAGRPEGTSLSGDNLAALNRAAKRLWEARPATTGCGAVAGPRAVYGLRLVVDDTNTEERPRLRVVGN